MHHGESKASVAILVALIGAVAVVIAALIGRNPASQETRAQPLVIQETVVVTQVVTVVIEKAVPQMLVTKTPEIVAVPEPSTTPAPTLPAPNNTPEVPAVEFGEEIVQGDYIIKAVKNTEIQYSDITKSFGLGFSIEITSKKQQRVAIKYNLENLKAFDNRGRQLEIFSGPYFPLNYGYTYSIEPDQTLSLNMHVLTVLFDASNTEVKEVIIDLSNTLEIETARWRFTVPH